MTTWTSNLRPEMVASMTMPPRWDPEKVELRHIIDRLLALEERRDPGRTTTPAGSSKVKLLYHLSRRRIQPHGSTWLTPSWPTTTSWTCRQSTVWHFSTCLHTSWSGQVGQHYRGPLRGTEGQTGGATHTQPVEEVLQHSHGGRVGRQEAFRAHGQHDGSPTPRTR